VSALSEPLAPDGVLVVPCSREFAAAAREFVCDRCESSADEPAGAAWLAANALIAHAVSRPQPAALLIVTLDVQPDAVLLDLTEHDLPPGTGDPPVPPHLTLLLDAVTRAWGTQVGSDHDISTWCVCGQMPLP
jgi:hypothetical protein